MVILRRGMNSKRESEQREDSKLSNLHLQKKKKKREKKQKYTRNSWARIEQSLTVLRIQWTQVYGNSNLSQGCGILCSSQVILAWTLAKATWPS